MLEEEDQFWKPLKGVNGIMGNLAHDFIRQAGQSSVNKYCGFSNPGE
jgi:hypothetical protein